MIIDGEEKEKEGENPPSRASSQFYNDLTEATDCEVPKGQDDEEKQVGEKKQDCEKTTETVKTAKRRYAFYHLYRYADALDIIFMLIGSLFALGRGAALPASLHYFGEILNAMLSYSPCWANVKAQIVAQRNGTLLAMMARQGNSTMLAQYKNATAVLQRSATIGLSPELAELVKRYKSSLESNEKLFDIVGPICGYYAAIGGGMLCAGIIHCVLWSVAGHRQLHRVRTRLFRAILSKDAGWFDARRSGALNNVLFEQVRKMENGMTVNVSLMLSWIGISISGFVVAFVTDWLVTIVIFSLVPLLFVCGFIMIKMVRLYSAKQSIAYGQAGSIANEVIGNARIVQAFNKQEYEVVRYCKHLSESMCMGTIRTVSAGTGQGMIFLITQAIAGLAFWWGNDPAVAQAGGNIGQIILCVMVATTALAMAGPNFEAIASAFGAADEVFAIIDEASQIDNFSEEGRRLESVTGNISFEDVAFAYPSRPNQQVFKTFSLDIKRGQTVALVGPSGCGKSTTVQMLLRFYDPTAGKVTLDGVNVQELNVRWLRHNIGLVSQEPILFNTTIKENIRLGYLDRGREATDDDIIAASKLANAHDFISELPDGYETMVGEGGAQLSGGQKQRIAIARALISNPKILVLDEATSALDTSSEKVVQEALDNARVGRTTLVIAHRLSTIRNADKIAVIDGGVVTELGDHGSLLSQRGLYYRLVKTQEIEAEERKNREGVDGTEADDTFQLNELDEITRQGKRHLAGLLNRDIVREKSVHEVENGEEVAMKKEESPNRWKMMGVVLKWGRPELIYTIMCSFIALLAGGVYPAFAIVASEFVSSYCPGESQDKFTMLIGVIVGIGAFHMVLMICEHYTFSIIGERLTKRMRSRLLGKILRMDAGWLDKGEHQPSVLTTILATDCIDIQGISGIRVNLFITNITTILFSIIYSLVLDYRVALAMLGIMPLNIVAAVLVARTVVQGNRVNETGPKGIAVIAMDAISNMRTVMSLGAEPFFLKCFAKEYIAIRNAAIKTNSFTGSLMSYSSSSILWSGAITFSVGGYLMQEGETDFLSVIRIYVLVVLCGLAIGRQNAAVPDEGSAVISAKKIVDILNYQTQIDCENPVTGESLHNEEIERHKELLSKPCTGRIEFKHVSFSYPNRPGVRVLEDISFTVEPGQQVALCGTSGGGKSTIIQLVQRLYDVSTGEILVDGVDIRKLNVRVHRSNIGLVSQEPVLFALSINENLCYGSKSQDEKPTKEQIDNVCQQANVHSFMEIFPDGLNTYVGERGAQLSGGQKQRIAIARALVRNPSILLLDEATSALDTEGEHVVQEALNAASAGRTSLTIAHRLSTIQNADKILVLDGGRVAEQGTHAELMEKQGIYYDLQLAQAKQTAKRS